MSERVLFPNEPIRISDQQEGVDAYLEDGVIDYDPNEHSCQTCGGDGFAECDEDDCFQANSRGFHAHFVTCPNCRGSGAAKDQWYW